MKYVPLLLSSIQTVKTMEYIPLVPSSIQTAKTMEYVPLILETPSSVPLIPATSTVSTLLQPSHSYYENLEMPITSSINISTTSSPVPDIISTISPDSLSTMRTEKAKPTSVGSVTTSFPSLSVLDTSSPLSTSTSKLIETVVVSLNTLSSSILYNSIPTKLISIALETSSPGSLILEPNNPSTSTELTSVAWESYSSSETNTLATYASFPPQKSRQTVTVTSETKVSSSLPTIVAYTPSSTLTWTTIYRPGNEEAKSISTSMINETETTVVADLKVATENVVSISAIKTFQEEAITVAIITSTMVSESITTTVSDVFETLVSVAYMPNMSIISDTFETSTLVVYMLTSTSGVRVTPVSSATTSSTVSSFFKTSKSMGPAESTVNMSYNLVSASPTKLVPTTTAVSENFETSDLGLNMPTNTFILISPNNVKATLVSSPTKITGSTTGASTEITRDVIFMSPTTLITAVAPSTAMVYNAFETSESMGTPESTTNVPNIPIPSDVGLYVPTITLELISPTTVNATPVPSTTRTINSTARASTEIANDVLLISPTTLITAIVPNTSAMVDDSESSESSLEIISTSVSTLEIELSSPTSSRVCTPLPDPPSPWSGYPTGRWNSCGGTNP